MYNKSPVPASGRNLTLIWFDKSLAILSYPYQDQYLPRYFAHLYLRDNRLLVTPSSNNACHLIVSVTIDSNNKNERYSEILKKFLLDW